jgi:hypothetical protein
MIIAVSNGRQKRLGQVRAASRGGTLEIRHLLCLWLFICSMRSVITIIWGLAIEFILADLLVMISFDFILHDGFRLRAHVTEVWPHNRGTISHLIWSSFHFWIREASRITIPTFSMNGGLSLNTCRLSVQYASLTSFFIVTYKILGYDKDVLNNLCKPNKFLTWTSDLKYWKLTGCYKSSLPYQLLAQQIVLELQRTHSHLLPLDFLLHVFES